MTTEPAPKPIACAEARTDEYLSDAGLYQMAPAGSGCPRGCPDGECYCAEPTFLSVSGICGGCGGDNGECYCGED